jgi:aminotransferase EvaB
VHFAVPDYRQPALSRFVPVTARWDATERVCRQVLTLPCFPELADEEVDAIVERIVAW